jgi:putative ABC transport system permease protein
MKLFHKIGSLFRRERLDAEMTEEMRHHVELQTELNLKAGLNAEDARYAALRQFGNVAVIQEQARERRGWLWAEQVRQDVRCATRSLGKSPGFTAVALVTLALGIGANTIAFSVLNALLLHTPPYPQPESIVRIYRTSANGLGGAHAPANFLDYRDQNTVFTHIAGIQEGAGFNLAEPGQPADRLRGQLVTADFFSVVGVTPALGRPFTVEEEREGNNAVVILSHQTWTRRYGSDPDIVGRQIRIDAAPVTIVGVMPPSADDPLLWGEVAAWRPLAMAASTRADRDNVSLSVIARLKPGVPAGQAQAALDALAMQLASAHAQFNAGQGLLLAPLGRNLQDGTARGISWLVVGLAGFVLLIACANLANLQFARQSARGREHAVRIALGASRGRLMGLVLAESVLLSFAGGALGLVLAVWGNDAVGRTFNLGGGAGLDIALDRRVLGFTFLVSVLAGVGFGLLPAWLTSRAKAGEALKQGGRSSTAGRSQHRIRRGLIVAEVALALVLLGGAGFFVRGLQSFLARDPGWSPASLLTADVSVRGPNYATAAGRTAFYRQLQERLASLPGVEHVALASSLPTAGYLNGNSFVVEGRPEPAAGARLQARVSGVTPGYFAALGIRLLQGRDFNADDDATKPLVVVINESMARQLWPGENPIGKRIGGATPFMSNPREIIGVVSDVRSVANFNNVPGGFQFYRSLAQWSQHTVTIALRSRHAPDTLAADLRRVVAGLDPDQAVHRIQTVEQQVDNSLRSIHAAAAGLAGFALIGMLLAAVGIYGVIATSVAERTHEIGIRMALGAQVRDVLELVIGGGLRLTLIGVGCGLIGALGAGRLMQSFLPELTAVDAGLTAGVTVILVFVAAFACWLPARRAARVDPVIALRAE